MSVNVLTLPADERQRPHDKHDDVYQTQSSAASLKDVEMLTRTHTHTHFIQASDANMSRDKVSVKQSATQQKSESSHVASSNADLFAVGLLPRSFRGRHSGSSPSISPCSLQHPVTQTLCMTFNLLFLQPVQ